TRLSSSLTLGSRQSRCPAKPHGPSMPAQSASALQSKAVLFWQCPAGSSQTPFTPAQSEFAEHATVALALQRLLSWSRTTVVTEPLNESPPSPSLVQLYWLSTWWGLAHDPVSSVHRIRPLGETFFSHINPVFMSVMVPSPLSL